MLGLIYVIEQLGVALKQANEVIGQLQAENQALKAAAQPAPEAPPAE